MRIAHLSDFHVFTRRPAQSLVRADAVERARTVVADVAAFTPKIDVAVVTGDLTEGDPADYALLRDVLSPLAMPVLVVPGNHDRREPLRAVFPDLPYADDTYLHYERTIDGSRFIALDSLSPGEVGGRLCGKRLDWVADRLAVPFEGETFLLIHHPPCPTATGVLDDAILLEGGEELRAMLAGLCRPATILCGHLHLPIRCRWDRSAVSVASSTAFQFALEMDAPQLPAVADEPFSYDIHIVDGVGGHVIHRRFVAL